MHAIPGHGRSRPPAPGPSDRQPDRSVVETRDQPNRPRDPRRWWALVIIDLCLLAITMDNTILNVALPTIARELGATGSQLQWIVDAYIVVFAGLLLSSGTLGDRLGRRRLLLSGLVVFGAASAGSLLVGSADQLIAIRALMGLGGALLMPATLSLITNIFAEDERPKAIASWAAVSGVGMVLGPVVGGALLEVFSWNAIFLVNVPLTAVGIVGALAFMTESRDERPGRTDPVGAILSIVALATLVYGIIDAPAAGWLTAQTFIQIGGGLGLLAAFVIWEAHVREPMFDIRLFARPAFGATSLAETVAHFALVGTMFALTQYLQFVWGQRPLEAGLSMLPIAIGVIAGSAVASRLQARAGARRLIAAGIGSLAVSALLVSRLAVDSPYLAFAVVLLFMSVGMGLAMAPATDSIMGAVDKARAGVGSATNDATRELGSALGVAVFGSILASGYRDTLVGALNAVPGGASALPPAVLGAVRDSIGSAVVAAGTLPSSIGAPVLTAARESFVSGMSAMALIAGAVLAVAAVILLHWLPTASPDAPVLERPDGPSESALASGVPLEDAFVR
jgi:EmrB/QacA subfamily drug resistance transporter